ncbi:MAG: hypothetical protein V4473_00575 [Patescibacteria group bacterium]
MTAYDKVALTLSVYVVLAVGFAVAGLNNKTQNAKVVVAQDVTCVRTEIFVAYEDRILFRLACRKNDGSQISQGNLLLGDQVVIAQYIHAPGPFICTIFTGKSPDCKRHTQ